MSPHAAGNDAEGLDCIADHDAIHGLFIGEGIGQCAPEIGIVAGILLAVQEGNGIGPGIKLGGVQAVIRLQSLQIRAGEVLSQLSFAGLHHLTAGAGLLNCLDQNGLVLIVRPAAPVVFIGLQHHGVLPGGLGNGIGTGASVVTGVEPLNILLHGFGADDISGIAGGGNQVDGGGVGTFKNDLVVAVGLYALHSTPVVGGALAQRKRALHRCLDISTGHLGAVVESHVLTQLEGPDGTIFIAAPLSGQFGFHLTGLGVVIGQGFVDILENHNAIGVLGAGV